MLTLFRLVMRGRLARFRSDLADPAAAQQRVLLDLLRRHAGTDFGRRHEYARLQTRDDFRRAVPIRPYEGFADEIRRMADGEQNVLAPDPLTMFAVTSGTSALPKLCPVTRAFTLEHHRTHLLWMLHLAQDHPRVTQGKYLTVVSPAETHRTTGGVPVGASSGRQYLNQAWPLRRKHAVPYEIFGIGDYAARYYCILRFALGGRLSTVTSVNPSTLVLLGRTLGERAEELLDDLASGRLAHAGLEDNLRSTLERHLKPQPQRARELREILRADRTLLPHRVWPELAAILTWQGGSAPFYLAQARELWGEAPMRCLGLRASEGTFSIPLSDRTPDGVLAVGGHVVEFLEEHQEPTPDAPTLLPHELENGKRYRMIITTSGGFARYDLADIVEVRGFLQRTPVIAFLHKAGNVLSVTGEKVTEDQIVEVVRRLAPEHPPLAGFTVTLELVDPPRLVLAVELQQSASDGTLGEYARAFDSGLRRINEEYDGKRASGRLADVRLMRLPEGAYRRHRAALLAEGRPDGQIKPPHLVRPPGNGSAPHPDCPFFRAALGNVQEKTAVAVAAEGEA